MKRVELLAPAGNYEALTGAIMAGADAVYLGGDAFGARAYADNFSQEEICDGIRLAHLFGKKIYLTVNTLVKEKEFPQLYSFLIPFYEAGLDGVIIQDLGAFCFIKEHFPKLSLHVSTQMTITGAYGAKWIKEAGAERIVPARELSLVEIKDMKEKAGIEIETFIHGAMCYCYSGQCLLSSILGGRSGNRGRCAQPCRLPYTVGNSKEFYPLSMKDMCTINNLPELIEAGIDSFKIEGRMKKPEYAAGVTAIYRKYIDAYYKNPTDYHVSDEDMEYLKALYIRSDIMEGYYHRHNGKEMITITSPAYSGSDAKLLADIRQKYVEKKPLLKVRARAKLYAECEAQFILTCKDCEVTVSGDLVQKAQKQPLSQEKVREQLIKSGNTNFEIELESLEMGQDIFMPVSALNSLRREAVMELEKKLIQRNGYDYSERKVRPLLNAESGKTKNVAADKKQTAIHVLVGNKEQLKAAVRKKVSRIYIDRIIPDETFQKELEQYKRNWDGEFYLAFPYIVRKKDVQNLKLLLQCLNSENSVFDGVMVRNAETIRFLQEEGTNKPIVTDSNMYLFNKSAYTFLHDFAREHYLPIELNQHEWKELKEQLAEDWDNLSMIMYGRLPMMLSANCLKKTTNACMHKAGFTSFKDRYRKEFPVYTDCTYCYNIIYNSVPLSLHKVLAAKGENPSRFRLDFTVETGSETEQVIRYFEEAVSHYKEPFYRDFTTGHYKRGVE